ANWEDAAAGAANATSIQDNAVSGTTNAIGGTTNAIGGTTNAIQGKSHNSNNIDAAGLRRRCLPERLLLLRPQVRVEHG
ncbi:hypothetical protein MTO96_044314, partial [Rhipicephalus appendiculatus]